MSKIIWSFEGTNVTFQSTPENFERDIVRMSKSVHLQPTHPILIHEDDRTSNANGSDSNGYSASLELKSVPSSTKKSKTTKATTELRDVSGDLAGSIDFSSADEPIDNGVADSSASDWLSNERI